MAIALVLDAANIKEIRRLRMKLQKSMGLTRALLCRFGEWKPVMAAIWEISL